MPDVRLVFRVQAVRRMFLRGVSENDVVQIMETGEVIEENPTDQPYPSTLILGWIGSQPLHLVVADNVDDGQTVLVTVYEPDLTRWEPEFRRRTP